MGNEMLNCFQLLVHLAAVVLTLILNVPVLLSNILLRLTTTAEADVPVFSTYLGTLSLMVD